MNEITTPVQIKQKLAAVIKARKPKAVVLPWWILTVGLGESIPYLQSPAENEWGSPNIPWIHAYMIEVDAMPRQNLGSMKMEDTIELLVWAFYQWKQGTTEKNSADIFITHCKDVQNAISQATKLQTDLMDLNTGVKEVKSHGEWQINKTGTYWFDKTRVHVAQGTLSVRANIQISNPLLVV